MNRQTAIEWIIADRIGVLKGECPADSADASRSLEEKGFSQVVTVRPCDFTMAWQIADSSLRNFMFDPGGRSGPSPRELHRLNEFCLYELAHGRRVPIWFEDDHVGDLIVQSIARFFSDAGTDLDRFVTEAMASQHERTVKFPPQEHVSKCTYCLDGLCRSDLACHATSVDNAFRIIESDRILSACKARGIPGEVLARESRNAAGDPPDYFEYVMFAAGNCTAVDKLVMEREVGHVPSWEELDCNFRPGVRFFFRTTDLVGHPRHCFDGIHDKIRDQLELDPYLVVVAIPEGLAGCENLTGLAKRRLPPEKVATHVFAGMHFRQWARRVYQDAQDRSVGAKGSYADQ